MPLRRLRIELSEERKRRHDVPQVQMATSSLCSCEVSSFFNNVGDLFVVLVYELKNKLFSRNFEC